MTTNQNDATIWHVVVIQPATANRAIELKYQLVDDGLIDGVDFEWRWHGTTWDPSTGMYPSETRFSFRDESIATFYRLKWQ